MTVPDMSEPVDIIAEARTILAPRPDFLDISVSTWHQTDKSGILLSAPATLCVLGDLLISSSGTDYKMASGYKLIQKGSTFHSVVLDIVEHCRNAFELSYRGMVTIQTSSRSVTIGCKNIIRVLGHLLAHDPDPDYLDALHNQLDNLQSQAAKTTKASEDIRIAFDSMVELLSDFGQSRVAAHDDKAKLAKTLQLKEEIAQKRKNSAAEVERRAAQHLQEIIGTYEKVRRVPCLETVCLTKMFPGPSTPFGSGGEDSDR